MSSHAFKYCESSCFRWKLFSWIAFELINIKTCNGTIIFLLLSHFERYCLTFKGQVQNLISGQGHMMTMWHVDMVLLHISFCVLIRQTQWSHSNIVSLCNEELLKKTVFNFKWPLITFEEVVKNAPWSSRYSEISWFWKIWIVPMCRCTHRSRGIFIFPPLHWLIIMERSWQDIDLHGRRNVIKSGWASPSEGLLFQRANDLLGPPTFRSSCPGFWFGFHSQLLWMLMSPTITHALTLARKRCFATFAHAGGGVGATPPGVWKRSVVELSGKDQRIALNEISRLVVYFLTLGQHLT